MKKNFYLSLFLLIPLMAFSQSKTQQQAFSEASAFLQKLNPTVTFSQSSPAKAMTQSSTATNEAQPYYVFNADNGKGFVIVSGDERTESILGYSDKGRIDMDNLPDGLKVLLQQYAAEIKSLGKTTTMAVKAKAASTSTASAAKTNISPMVTSEWNQSSPYYNQCPTYNGYRCITGCVATAMAQVMYYWGKKGYNISATAMPAYTTTTDKISVSALPAVTFDWASMQDDYRYTSSSSTSKAAVAKLMRYAGQSVLMDYDPDGSNAWGIDMGTGFRDYLGFDKQIRVVYRQDYTEAEWEDLIYNELAAGRPVDTGGSYWGNTDWVGHEYVCDGYQSGKFHINWGWGGSEDGYFKLSALNANGGSNGFNVFQDLVIGIQPQVDGHEEIQENTHLTISDMFFSGSNTFTRKNRWSDFTGISIFNGLYNHLQRTDNFDAALGLYNKDNVLIKILATRHIGENKCIDGLGKEFSFDNISFGSELPYGDYIIKALSKGNDESEWGLDVKGDRHYITASITENNLTLTPSIPLTVNSLDNEGYAEITNSGNNESSCILYLFSNGSLTSAIQTALQGGITTTVPFGATGDVITTDIEGKNIIYPSQSQYISLSAETINATDANVVAGSNLKVKVTVTNKGTSAYSGTVKAGSASQSVNVAVGSAQTVTLSVPVSSSTAVTATCGSESLSLGTFTSGKGVVFYNGDGTHSCKADADVSTLADNVACIDLTNSSKDYSSMTLSANPNCIYLFGSSVSVSSNFNGKNVVKGTTADNISLQDGYDFYCPIFFTATNIKYTRTFTKGTTGGDDGQWSSIILPFKPTSVTVDSKTIDWFHSKTDVQGSFWLFGFTGDKSGTVNFDYVPQNGMEANTPYIITVPANTWGAENDLRNKALVFSATEATINTTKGVVNGTDYDFIGWPFNMKRLSVNEYKLNNAGNAFALISDESLKTIEPFRAYFVTYTSNANAKLNIGLPDDETTGVNMPQVSGADNQGDVYTISGMKVRTATQSTKGLEKGIYIVNGKKVIK
jgi:hypothetical protein